MRVGTTGLPTRLGCLQSRPLRVLAVEHDPGGTSMTAQHGFKAEVQQLLNLMIHSVYSDREVFLRELVSNGADALDKARFLSLTRKDLLAVEGEQGIRVSIDADAKTITIECGSPDERDATLARVGAMWMEARGAESRAWGPW